MSEEKPIGLAVAEKLFGLLLVLIGAITAYVTYSNPPSNPPGGGGAFSFLFIACCFVLIAVGILLILAKPE